MAIDYLGHKKMLREMLVRAAESHRPGRKGVFLDLFCGTASVSGAFSRHGYRVVANDILSLCVTFAEAVLLNGSEPRFSGIAADVKAKRGTAYHRVIEYLNGLEPEKGFFSKEYSPAGRHGRKYFTSRNAQRIDAIRRKLMEWQPRLTRGENALLRVNLIRAVNAIANTAGTYGCYLKSFKGRALGELHLAPLDLELSQGMRHSVFQSDANQLARSTSADVVYADPPYTKRQYAAYYHILETISMGDEPLLIGSTGLRPWKDRASAYCYKRTAASALQDLVDAVDCKLFLMSYSEDGHVSHGEIMDILGRRGDVTVRRTIQKRYKSSSLAHKGDSVVERLYVLRVK